MAVFTVESSPTFADLRTRFERGRKAVKKSSRVEMNRLRRLHVTEIKRLAPKDKGDFAAGIDSKIVENGESVGFSVSTPQPLGKWLRPPGTKPHVIEARPGGALRFVARGGNIVFTKKVNHPGYRPKSDFVEDAVSNLKSERKLGLRRIVTRYIEQVVK